jgi:hypothetical protein
MFSSEERVKQIIEKLIGISYKELESQTYTINEYELLSICEDFMTFKNECECMSEEMQSLRNYIRLLEKENQELKERK